MSEKVLKDYMEKDFCDKIDLLATILYASGDYNTPDEAINRAESICKEVTARSLQAFVEGDEAVFAELHDHH